MKFELCPFIFNHTSCLHFFNWFVSIQIIGVKYIDCVANCPGLDEDKAIKRLSTETDVNCSKKLKIELVEKQCLLLRLSSIPELFESKEILHSSIMALVQKIADAGDIDKSVDSNMDIQITFTSPLTDGEYWCWHQ